MPENSHYALERLRELLRVTTLFTDGKLPTERALSERFGVGRREIRRALEVLEAEGLIWRKQGAGTFLGQKPDNWSDQVASLVPGTNFMEIMEVRLRIEPQLAQLAAMRAKDSDIERMPRAARQDLRAHRCRLAGALGWRAASSDRADRRQSAFSVAL